MGEPRRLRRAATLITIGVIAVGAGAAVVWLRPWAGSPEAQGGTTEPVTAQVELATLTDELRLNAQLGYGVPVPIAPATGTITVLPSAGASVMTGERVYEADGAPVLLLRGPRPFWRELSTESEDGEDVRQLQQNLSDLGFFDGEIDGVFDWRTRQAVRDWQESSGLPITGTFSPASAVVADAPGIRIGQVTARLGESGVSPATMTETTLRAVAKLTAAQARELVAGTPVRVVLPDGQEVEATIAAVDPGGEPTGEADAVTGPTATIAFPDQDAVAAAGSGAVRVIVGAATDEEPTLVVPVTALLATAEGGYVVEVVDGDEIVRVPVEIGRVADARVQILASGAESDGGRVLAVGDRVVLAR